MKNKREEEGLNERKGQAFYNRLMTHLMTRLVTQFVLGLAGCLKARWLFKGSPVIHGLVGCSRARRLFKGSPVVYGLVGCRRACRFVKGSREISRARVFKVSNPISSQ
jgi:hypothetical protein